MNRSSIFKLILLARSFLLRIRYIFLSEYTDSKINVWSIIYMNHSGKYYQLSRFKQMLTKIKSLQLTNVKIS